MTFTIVKTSIPALSAVPGQSDMLSLGAPAGTNSIKILATQGIAVAPAWVSSVATTKPLPPAAKAGTVGASRYECPSYVVRYFIISLLNFVADNNSFRLNE